MIDITPLLPVICWIGLLIVAVVVLVIFYQHRHPIVQKEWYMDKEEKEVEGWRVVEALEKDKKD